NDINPTNSFVVSSVFPYCADLLFYPKPFKKIRLGREQEEDLTLSKKLKSVNFLSSSVLKNVLQDREIEIKTDREKSMIIDDTFLVAEKEVNILKNIDFIVKTTAVAKNMLDRITNLSEIFHIGETQVNTKQGCGYYFFIKPSERFPVEKLRNSLELLGDEGLGGNRSVGKGAFKIILFEEYKFPVISNDPTKIMILSLYNPEEREIKKGLLDGAEYDLTVRGGWLYTSSNISWRKKRLRMFQEGSIFRNICPVGRIVNLAPVIFKDHKIYHNGLAFYLPF
ncbi:MAG TPA: type III-A CRISPR-associated RAMP protein Csm4, partial [Candidatus Ratteibacteria bacterium]|nr:type III-A CRISPR-associated RAMP protein Csm4 [Candidatus Ratteibacteria bacterium]